MRCYYCDHSSEATMCVRCAKQVYRAYAMPTRWARLKRLFGRS
jgi:hypothetical protein